MPSMALERLGELEKRQPRSSPEAKIITRSAFIILETNSVIFSQTSIGWHIFAGMHTTKSWSNTVCCIDRERLPDAWMSISRGRCRRARTGYVSQLIYCERLIGWLGAIATLICQFEFIENDTEANFSNSISQAYWERWGIPIRAVAPSDLHIINYAINVWVWA